MTATLTLIIGILADFAVILYAFPAFYASKRRRIGLIAYGALCFLINQLGMFVLWYSEHSVLLNLSDSQYESCATVLDLLHILGLALSTTGIIMICNEFTPKNADEIGENKV